MRLLQPWCQANAGSCLFMMGQCYLVTGEGHKVRGQAGNTIDIAGELPSSFLSMGQVLYDNTPIVYT